MSTAVKYIIDDNGHKTSVLVPVKTWDDLNEKYKKLNKKLAILTGIQQGIAEVKENHANGRSLQALSDFLSEGNSCVAIVGVVTNAIKLRECATWDSVQIKSGALFSKSQQTNSHTFER
jgi:hypothetical protein